MKINLNPLHYFYILSLCIFLGLETDVFGQKIQIQTASNSNLINYTEEGEKCGHSIIESKIEKEMGFFGSSPFFENWIEGKIEEKRISSKIQAKTTQEIKVIPVVVHVIHSGQGIGSGANIPLIQIENQIKILNADFRRQNQDASQTNPVFLPVAADSNIEFVLAKQDPQGLPTSGIVRVQGPKTLYTPTDATLIGQISQWNPSEYLNIWVLPLSTPYIGYASFPISDLPGLNFSPSSAITDGVTIDYRYFGTGGNAFPNFFGRTATHEIGHYLGLRHIWGDGGCEVDDFVLDTPLQNSSNNICNATVTKSSCGNLNMIQNFMDYTPDPCMNLFTKGQVERFEVVLANSPRRVSLVNNRATKNPVLEERDLAISRIISPSKFACSSITNTTIEVKNAGSSLLNSGRVLMYRNGVLLENKKFNFSLTTGQATVLEFQNVILTSGPNEFEFKITESNDQVDQNTNNNIGKITTSIQEEIQLPNTLDISNFPSNWFINNPDNSLSWEKIQVNLSGKIEDMVQIRHFDYNAIGQLDYLISPVIDLSKNPNAQLVFEMAHALYGQSDFLDDLVVAVSQDCGNTFDFSTATYNKFGQTLTTSEPLLNLFLPTNQSQFRTEIVNLNKFKELGKVKIAFISKNGFGNNIYLKNIRILPNEEFKYELTINEMITPGPIVDGSQELQIIRITNTGNLPVSKFIFTRSTNDTNSITFLASGLEVTPGNSFLLDESKTTTDGKNKLSYTVFQPNFDQNKGQSGSTLQQYIIENKEVESSPWRQRFNTSSISTAPWVVLNPEKDLTGWQVSPITSGKEQNNNIKLQNQIKGNSYWVGSPLFDMSKSRQGSIFFDLAAGKVNPETSLKLMFSENGGETYTEIWKLTGAQLSTVSSGEANPNTQTDFSKKYINLSNFAGNGKTRSRVAFVVENGSETDPPIYIDNIEFFLSENPDPVIPTEGRVILYPNPATDLFHVAFNLSKYEDVTIQVLSSTGAMIHEITYPQTLNQTYSFSTELFSKGLFVLKISSNSIQETKKLIIN
jgi:hypothetical protein